REIAYVAIDRFEQLPRLDRPLPVLHLGPLVVDDARDVVVHGRTYLAPVRERTGVPIDDREIRRLIVRAHLRLLEALPDTDCHEGQEHGVDDAHDGQNEPGQVVMFFANALRKNPAHDVTENQCECDESDDDDDPGTENRKRFEPENHRTLTATAA